MDDVSNAIKQLSNEQRFFHLFSQEELALLFPLFGMVNYPKKALVFGEGDSANIPFFVVYNGSLEVRKSTDFGRPFVLARINRGALMGQLSFAPGNARASVSAITLEETDLLILSADRIARLFNEHPEVGVKLLKEVIRVQNIRMNQLVYRLTSAL